MALIRFTSALKRFYPTLAPVQTNATTIAGALMDVDAAYPGLSGYLMEDDGSLRKHVNIFVGGHLIKDQTKLLDKVADQDEIYIMQALSGG